MDGKDKGLVDLAGKPMVEYVIESFSVQTKNILINANRNHNIYSRYGYPVISDEHEGYQGPLAGIYSALKVMDSPYLVSAPCDSPFVPVDLIERLMTAIENEHCEISVAHDGNRMQPVFACISQKLESSLNDYLAAGERKIDLWYAQHHCVIVDFSDVPETFLNINSRQDIEQIEHRLDKV